MDCYIEVSWLFMTVISFCAYGFASTLTSKQYVFYKALMISALGNALVLFKYQSLFWVLLITFLEDLWLSEFQACFLFEIALTRFFLLLVLAKRLHGTLVNTVLFIPLHQLYLPALFGLGLFFLLSVYFLHPLAAYQKLEYQVKVTIQNHTIQVKGFMDSGNFLEYKNIPVIFLNEKYHALSSGLLGVKIDYNTLSGKAECRIYPAIIQVRKKQKKVYVAFLDLDDGLDCLLNSQLMEYVKMA